MSTSQKSDPAEKSPAEAAGYIAGTLTGFAEMFMPIRMWITLVASAALLIFAFTSDSPLNIARALCIFAVLVSVLLGSAVYSRRSR